MPRDSVASHRRGADEARAARRRAYAASRDAACALCRENSGFFFFFFFLWRYFSMLLRYFDAIDATLLLSSPLLLPLPLSCRYAAPLACRPFLRLLIAITMP